MQDQLTVAVAGQVNGGQARAGIGSACLVSEVPSCAVGSVISCAVLRAVREGCGESQEEFATRTGLARAAVNGIEDGSCSAWALPWRQYQAVEAAIGVTDPGLCEVFYVAAACDLYLTAMMEGDDQTAEGALATLRQHPGLAFSLLGWAVSGVLDGQASGYLAVPASAPLLPVGVLAEMAGQYLMVLVDGCGCPGSVL